MLIARGENANTGEGFGKCAKHWRNPQLMKMKKRRTEKCPAAYAAGRAFPLAIYSYKV